MENRLAGDVAEVHLQLQGEAVQNLLTVGDVVVCVLGWWVDEVSEIAGEMIIHRNVVRVS